jgi:hypothetical protein
MYMIIFKFSLFINVFNFEFIVFIKDIFFFKNNKYIYLKNYIPMTFHLRKFHIIKIENQSKRGLNMLIFEN